MLNYRQDRIWQASPQVRHGFFTRRGGASRGLYAGLNCGLGSQDDRRNVEENLRRVAQEMRLESSDRLFCCAQVHSADVVIIDDVHQWDSETQPKADGMVTKLSKISLGVLSADCAPILFVDRKEGVIGAAHAGWKGAFLGVAEKTVVAMETLGALRGQIEMVVGPCIAQESYQVGRAFYQNFLDQDVECASCFMASEREEHFQFDLVRYLIKSMNDKGLADIRRLLGNTYLEEEEFFSYRRSVHRQEADYGRQISTISLVS